MTPRLSVLDQSVACASRGEDDAIRDTLALAEHAEALGYERFWVSEHHGLPTIVGTAPEVLMAAVAARTKRIRIGSAGVMLPHYAALNPHVSGMAEDFPEQVADLQAWVSGVPHHGIVAHPRPPAQAGMERAPQLWVLGSSDYGAQLAAHLGLPYAFAYFFMDGQGVEQALHLYRALYRPSARHPRPQATVCVWALAADNDEEARFHALSRERWRVDRMRGALGPLRPPAEVAERNFSAEEMAIVAPMRRRAFVGSAAQVGQQLRALATELQLDELVVNTWAHDPAVRRHSYALLAREFAS
jgi:luciferase family oxidoreductase group 1